MQKTSVAAFMSKYCKYTAYQQKFADMILWQHRKIHRLISSPQRKCGFMLKCDIKSYCSTTDPFQARCATGMPELDEFLFLRKFVEDCLCP